MAPPTRRPSNGKPSGGYIGAFVRFWRASYASDYVGFLVLMTAFIFIEFYVDPFHRMFYIDNLNISFPHAEVERVPVAMNFVYALFAPLFIMLIWNAASGAGLHKHHTTILGLFIALVLTSTLTNIVKNMVGRPRPDLIARCKPSSATPSHTLVSFEVCTETDHQLLHDGWRSFPSGHSSFAFAGLGYMTLFLAGQLKVFVLRSNTQHSTEGVDRIGISNEKPVHVRGDLGKALLCLTPLLGAVMIAISRCQDYRHDVYDVCVGALLGWVVTYWSYRRYWPRLNSSYCSEPYPSPASLRADNDRYGRLRDEEEGLDNVSAGQQEPGTAGDD